MKITLDLIKKTGEKDASSFALIFKHYYLSLVSYAFSIVNYKEVAEDIVMSIFEKLPSAIERIKFTSVDHFQRWLYKTTKYKSLNYLDEIKRNRVCTLNEETMVDKSESKSSFELDELKECLSREEYLVIVLRFINGYSLKDIAKILNKSIDQIKKISAKTIREVKKFYNSRK